MKRVLTCLLLALSCQVSPTNAQYNKTFYHTIVHSSADVNTTASPIDIIDGGNGTTVTLAHSWPKPSTGLPKYLVLRRLDFNGNVLMERAHEIGDRDVPSRIIATPDGGYIVVGNNWNNSKRDQIFATKFDNTFNITWGKVYEDPTGYAANSNGVREIVNIVKVASALDDYIIVGTGGSHLIPIGGGQNAYPISAISVIRINGTLGQIVPNGTKKYFHPLATATYVPPINPVQAPGVMYMRRESPSALAYGDGKYFIGGFAMSKYYTAKSDETKYTNFVMAIDENLNIVNQYKEFTIPGDPSNPFNTNPPESYSNHDGVFDATTQEFIMSFTISGFRLANGINKTEIGIVKFASNLGYNDLKYYFDPSNVDHYGFRIKETYAQDGYIVAAGVNQFLTANACTPALLKVDKTGTIQFYHRYNNGQGFHMVGSFLAQPAVTPVVNAGVENYAISCSRVGGHTRVISTDVNGMACGYEDHAPQYHVPSDISPNVLNYGILDDRNELFGTIFQNPLLTVDEDDCSTYGGDPINYKPTVVADVAVSTSKIYPTILETENNTVVIESNVDAATNGVISISGIDGRILETIRITLDKGNNKTSYTLPISTPGMYLLKLSSDKNELNQVIKIYKQ